MLLKKEALLTHIIAAKQDPRFAINGIRIEADGSAVATDRHRKAEGRE